MPYVACQLESDAAALSLTGDAGTLDLNEHTLTLSAGLDLQSPLVLDTGGKFVVQGGTVLLDGLTIDGTDFDLSAGVLGTSVGCDVTNSTVTYVTAEMDATDASNTDSGGNVGWDFGGTVNFKAAWAYGINAYIGMGA